MLRLFGSHRELLRAAGYETYSSASRLNDQVLLRAMRDAVTAAGGVPTRDTFAGHCRHDLRTVVRRWGGWEMALAALRDWLEANEPAFVHLPALRRKCAGIRLDARSHVGPRCGELIRFRGLDHAPTNEMGVVFLFGAVAADLGFILDSVGTAFPDAHGRRRVGRGWQPVRIEFELQSRTFRHHEHNAEKCDLIVCWQDNWPESPLEVLELKSRIKRLQEQGR